MTKEGKVQPNENCLEWYPGSAKGWRQWTFAVSYLLQTVVQNRDHYISKCWLDHEYDVMLRRAPVARLNLSGQGDGVTETCLGRPYCYAALAEYKPFLCVAGIIIYTALFHVAIQFSHVYLEVELQQACSSLSFFFYQHGSKKLCLCIHRCQSFVKIGDLRAQARLLSSTLNCSRFLDQR